MHIRHWLLAAGIGMFSTALQAADAPSGPPPGGGPSPEMRALFDAVNKSCAEDLKTVCDGKTGREGMMCLRTNQAKLSAPCKEAVGKLPAPPAGRPPGGGAPPSN